MRVLGPSSEAEMVAVFLRGELESERFGPGIREALRRRGLDVRLLESPVLGDLAEDALRRSLLDETRGYERREGLFDGFPDDVVWTRVALSREELAAVRYITYSYWNDISGGTRDPSRAADRIREGILVFGRMPTDGFLEAARAFAGGAHWPELIVVSDAGEGRDVVLEGHVRLTAMALAPEAVPPETVVLRGVSPRIATWTEYPDA